MKKISRWASKNKISARVLIVLIHLILFYLGIKAGLIFWKLDIYISGWVLFTAILVYVSAFFLYPAKEDIRRSKNKKKHTGFKKQMIFY